MSLKVGIVGAAGYAGAELSRLERGHPAVELVGITSHEAAVRGVAELCWCERPGVHHA